MYTYQDLLAAGGSLDARTTFINNAIEEHTGSKAYRTAADAELYYNGENPTISKYEKILYDLQGKAHRDMFTANHKLASSFFRFDVNQQVAYLLGNGVTFADKNTADKLCPDFDQEIMTAATYAQIGGIKSGCSTIRRRTVCSS